MTPAHALSISDNCTTPLPVISPFGVKPTICYVIPKIGKMDFMRVVFPIRHYKDEGFVERTIEINEEDLPAIIEEYLLAHGDFEFDEIEIVNKRPMNIWLHAKCRKFIDPDEPEEEQVSKAEAEEEISGKYEDNNEPA